MKHHYYFIFKASALIILLSYLQISCQDKESKSVTSTKDSKTLVTNTYNQEYNNNSVSDSPYIDLNSLSQTPGIKTVSGRTLLLYQPDVRYYHKDYGYVRGKVLGDNSEQALIYISGEEVHSSSGYFEQLAKRPFSSQSEEWEVEIKAIFPDGETIVSHASFSSTEDVDELNTIPINIEDIEPDTRTSLSYSSATLYVEPGSVSTPKSISVSPLESRDLPLSGLHLSNVTKEHSGYRFLPDGTKFEKELVIAIGYDQDKIPFGYGPQDIYSYYYDNTLERWLVLERDSVDEEKQIVYSRTDHFTDYINGILQTPETSDAMAYTPTSIKDLEAAQPLNGITMMSPPQANNKGTANLSYPITIPQGRRGMQPDLNITYNSSGGNGWLGLGWDLSISSITVETRWGVPYYDPDKESETYLLDGETLVTSYYDEQNQFRLNKPAYQRSWDLRSDVINPEDNTTQFYPRVEGAFRKIIRHGTDPQNFWWEVIDKNGTRYFYGKKQNEEELDSCGVLFDYKGNVAKWCLTGIKDVYGNYVEYEYTTKFTSGSNVEGTVGKQIYPETIKYTGYKADESSTQPSESGKYSISFKLDKIREDIVTSGRYGFKETNAWLLDKVEILYDNDLLKAYYFGYKTGFAGKTLLCNIIEADSLSISQKYYDQSLTEVMDVTKLLEKDVFNRCNEVSEKDIYYFPYIEHRFNYETLEEEKAMFSEEETIITEDDNIKGNIIPFLGMKIGDLEGTLTKSFNIGGALSVGYDWNVMRKTLSLGGNYMFGKDNSEGLLCYIDLNGDGYVDKLYKKGDSIYYRLRDPNSNSFGNQSLLNLKGFLKSSGYTNSWGVEGDLGVGGFGVNWTDGKTTTSGYFIDLNGDGLIDYVDNEKKYINQLDSGIPTFVRINEFSDEDIPILGDCGNVEYISFGNSVNEDIFSSGSYEVISTKCSCLVYSNDRNGECIKDSCWEEIETVQYDFPETFEPNMDNVRVWVAPYDGTIKIEGVAKYTSESFLLNQLTYNSKGVKLSIEKNGVELSHVILKPVDSVQSFLFSNVNSISVAAGDKVFFRMQSLGKRKYDEVIWNPKITYLGATYKRGNVTVNANISDSIDASGLNMYQFNYSEDLLLTGKQKIKMPFSGKIAIVRDIKSNGLRGSVTCNIIKNANNNIQSFTINNNTEINDSTIYNVQANDLISIVMKGEGNTNWPSIDANIRIVVVEKTGGTAEDVYNTYSDGETKTYYYSYYPMIEKASYAYQKLPSIKHTTTSQSLSIKPKLSSVNSLQREVIITVKDTNGNALLSEIFTWPYGNAVPTYSVNLNGITDYFIDYHVQGSIGETFTNALAIINNENVEAGLYINYSDFYDKFGINFRNWGQFGYWNHSNDSIPIDESLLVLDNTFNQTSVPDPSSLTIPVSRTSNDSNIFNPLSSSFFLMFPDFEKKCFIGYGDCISTNKDVVANKVYSTYINVEDLDLTDNPLPISANNSVPITTVNKLSYTDNIGYDIGFSISTEIPGFGINEGGSITKGSTRQISDMIDINGDGYPDIVSEVSVQLSQPQGGLSSITRPHAVGGRFSDSTYNETVGGSFGGSYVVAKKLLSNNPKKSLTTLSAGTGASISGATTENNTQYSWVDINGDGLLDKVTKDGIVNLNIGNGFLSDEIWSSIENIRKSYNEGVGLSVSGTENNSRVDFSRETQEMIDNLMEIRKNTADDLLELISGIANETGNSECNVSINIGLGGTHSENENTFSYIDINGDGLVDKVLGNKVYYNLGDKFSISDTSILPSLIETATCYNANLTGAFTLGTTLGPLPVKIQGNPKSGASRSLAKNEIKWIDMNNDGYPDYVRDGNNGELIVRYSNLGHVNLLKEVIMPTLSSYNIDYSLSQSSTDSPQRHWTMSSLEIKDGFSEDCDETRKMTFEYKNRKYSRYEREDYGFDTVITAEYISPTTIYRKTIDIYHNNGYMFSGLKHTSIQADSILGIKHLEHIKTYDIHEILTGVKINVENPQCYGDGYPAVSKENFMYYDNNQLQLTTEKKYMYTSFGNVEEYQNLGDITIEEDNIYSDIEYSNDETNYYVSLVKQIEVRDQQGVLLKKRGATYNNLGAMDFLIVFNNGNQIEHHYEYDNYGNIKKAILPPNNLGQHLIVEYEYDNMLHTYPTRVANNYQYESTSSYDFRWGKPLITTDINGNQMHYTYDTRGRTKTIRGPKEIASGQGYTIEYDYWDRERRSQIEHKKIIPWSKTSNYDSEYSNNNIEVITFADGLGRIIQIKKDIERSGIKKRSVSGKIMYDALDRPIAEYHPQEEDVFNSPYSSDTIFNYSPHSYPPTQTEYDILDRPTQIIYPDQSTTKNEYSIEQDYNGINRFKTIITDQNNKETTIYSDHRELKTQIVSANGATTKFAYDALGQLTQSIDPENHPTSYEYDMLGRRTKRTHPSAGETQWQYDPAGNLTKQIMSSGEFIDYTYNFNQLTNVSYSDRPWNNVWYEYGGAGSGNQTGRLIKQQDATGVQEFEYGNMGELIKNKHTYTVPNSEPFTLTTEWEYDSWNRVKTIIYPDNEKVTYNYNLGGLLKHVEGDKPGIGVTDYIKDINYDEYEQRTAVYNGNGTRTYYTYDPVMRRMTNLNTISPNGDLLKLKYSYDYAGNITRIENTGMNPYVQNYTYDDNYQLTHANGNWDGQIDYSLDMGYSPSGRIENKGLGGHRIDNQGTYSLDYNNDYHYNHPNNPYALSNIFNQMTGEEHYFNWDIKGNMTHHLDINQGNERHLCWTEDNRLQGIQDNNMGVFYGYDASGERGLKLTGPTIQVNINGYNYQVSALKEQTLYASPLITINDKGYTKHYFEEGKRICSKIGSGELREINDLVNHMGMNYEDQLTTQYEGIKDGNRGCIGGGWFDLENNNLYKSIIQPYGNPINPEEPIFYYHSDHLGSASFLTDRDGYETQQLVYLPFGEDWVDMKYNTSQYDTPYKFNGKEKDSETGYNNYGARYYYDWASIWLSVDPNSDNYPHATSYAYCNNNPIMLIDPDGKDWYQPDDGSSAIYIRGNEKSKIVQGEVYNNIGKSFSAQNMDGSYTNYYQNYAISIGDKQNAEKIAKNNPEVRAFLISNKSNLPLEDKKSLFNSNVASRGINTEAPDMMGLQFSGNAFLGGGGAVDLTVGYMRNEGFFSNASLRIGVGVDISISAGIVTGNYTGGGSPTSSSLSGGSLYQNVGAGFMNCGAGQDIRRAKEKNIGQYWNTRSIGVSFGTKTVYGGSTGVSITTPPLKF